MEDFHCSKNIQTFHGTRFEYFEQHSKLGWLQILNRIHDKNSGTYFNLNFLWILKGSKPCGKNLVNSLKMYLSLFFPTVNLVGHTYMQYLGVPR
jgi:hypothetical protein